MAHFHHFNPCSVQNPLIYNLPRSHSPTSVSLGIPNSSPFASTPFSSPKVSTFHFFDNLGEMRTLRSVRELHAQIFKMPNKGNLYILDKTLIRYYLEFGDFISAIRVFFVGYARNYFSWDSFLEEFESFGGDPHEILEVFKELHKKGVDFNSTALGVVLKICSNLMDLWLGLEIQARLIKRGFKSDVHLNCALINFYGNCWGDVDRANQVFLETTHQEDFLWNTIVMVSLKSEKWLVALELFRNMQLSSAKATGGTIVKLLQACAKLRALNEGKQIHGYVLKRALDSNMLICNSIISMYSRNNRFKQARAVFDSMQDHNLSSWNSIISSYVILGRLDDAWDLFQEMDSSSNVEPDVVTWNTLLSGHLLEGSHETVLTIFRRMQSSTFRGDPCSVTSALQAIIELDAFSFGKEVHGYIIRNSLDYDVYVSTSLVDMYVKNDCLEKAQAVFDNAQNKNICAWNSLISGYAFNGKFLEAEATLNQMEKEGIKPDLVTWNGLVSGYSMHDHSEEALAVIHRIRNSGLTPNVVSWTAMISGCTKNENYKDALKVFTQMQAENVEPNSATICSLLSACAGLSLLKKGEEIHCLSVRLGFVDDSYIATALIDMYSKASKLKVAYEIFKRIHKTLPCWNCMMMGFAIYGHGKEVISLFDEMCRKGIRPDAISFTALLSGCKNSGLVSEGWKYFDSMKTDHNIIPTIEHYSCMVDLLGKAGYLDEAWDFVHTMPVNPDASIWGALLASSRIHKNVKLAEFAARNLIKLEPQNSSNFVLMMNLYSTLNRWEDVERVKETMIALGVKSPHVWSWIQVNQDIHMFSTEGKPHPDEGQIYYELHQLVSDIQKMGYVADISCVYQNIEDHEKEKVLLSHTEKLALTYGLMKLKTGVPIRVVKNTRICYDCHNAAKFISLARNREIFLRDGGRFHHFVNGKCSCNDCW